MPDVSSLNAQAGPMSAARRPGLALKASQAIERRRSERRAVDDGFAIPRAPDDRHHQRLGEAPGHGDALGLTDQKRSSPEALRNRFLWRQNDRGLHDCNVKSVNQDSWSWIGQKGRNPGVAQQ